MKRRRNLDLMRRIDVKAGSSYAPRITIVSGLHAGNTYYEVSKSMSLSEARSLIRDLRAAMRDTVKSVVSSAQAELSLSEAPLS